MLADFPRVLGVSKPLLDIQIEFGKVETSRNPRIAKETIFESEAFCLRKRGAPTAGAARFRQQNTYTSFRHFTRFDSVSDFRALGCRIGL